MKTRDQQKKQEIEWYFHLSNSGLDQKMINETSGILANDMYKEVKQDRIFYVRKFC